MRYTTSALLISTLLFTACDDGGADAPRADAMPGVPDAGPAADADPFAGEDLDMKAEDFECVLNWDKVRRFRITNGLGHLEETLAVANNPAGGDYPVGTIIQLVPIEAMVKRKTGWNPASGDWEFFNLDVSSSGTTIVERGIDPEPSNQVGSCRGCHAKTMPAFDFVCETTHGCDPLPDFVTPELIEMLQNNDPRCSK